MGLTDKSTGGILHRGNERHQRATREASFFDLHVAEHGEYDVLGDGAYRRLVSIFEQHVQPRSGERCIDLGCGTGAFTRRIRHLGLQLHGIDISPAAVAAAQSAATTERYQCGDITCTDASNGSFDIILYSGVLHHFPSVQDRTKVLAEGFRLLSPGGRLFAFDPNQLSPSMFLYRDPRSPLFSPKGKTENEVLLRASALKRELAGVGFTGIQIKGVSGIQFRYVSSRAARIALPLYNAYERLMQMSPLETALGTFLVTVAHKT